MSYIGNQVTSVPFVVDLFSGDSSTTSFGPMVRAPAGTAAIAVFISGVYKVPGVDYTVSGPTITFTAAPASGTNNIVVHHLGNGVMATQVPGDGTITGNKLQDNIIRGNNIVEGQITGNLIAVSQITGNLIASNTIAGNAIGTGQITGNLIASNTIAGNAIGTGQITGNLIASDTITGNAIIAGQITGNLIGTGAISANHYAGGGVTSEVLASNLQISVARVAETINVYSTPLSGNFNIHTAESTVYYFTSNTTGNSTLNLVANTGSNFAVNSLDAMVKVGQSVSVTCFVKQGSTRFRANVFIDGERANTIFWVGNAQPQYQESQQQSLDVYNISAIKIAANTWTVIAGNTATSYANGQGMGATNGSVY